MIQMPVDTSWRCKWPDPELYIKELALDRVSRSKETRVISSYTPTGNSYTSMHRAHDEWYHGTPTGAVGSSAIDFSRKCQLVWEINRTQITASLARFIESCKRRALRVSFFPNGCLGAYLMGTVNNIG